MAKCAIIGGGLSGLSSAVYLSEQGHSIDLIEATPKLGGRTYSFPSKNNSIEIDNGQHLMMGAYKNTFEFLKIIDSFKLLEHQDKLFIPFVSKEKKNHYLKTTNNFYPFNLFKAILQFDLLTKGERLKILSLFIKLFFNKKYKFEKITAYDWLIKNNQTENAIKLLWNVISVGALNTDIKKASAKTFIKTLEKIFLNGDNSAKFTFTNVPLNKLFIIPTINYLKSKLVNIYLTERLIYFRKNNDLTYELTTNKRILSGYDFIILAVPFNNLLEFEQFSNYKYIEVSKFSPIITIHVFLNRNIFLHKFYGFIDSPIHWLFNNDSHITLVISSAENLINKKSTEIIELCLVELKNYFNEFKIDDVYDSVVLKQKRATVKATNELEEFKRNFAFSQDNLYIIGDWTVENFPSTIESSILSGKLIVQEISKNF